MRLQHIIGVIIVLCLFVWAAHRVVSHFSEAHEGAVAPPTSAGSSNSLEASTIYQEGCNVYRDGNAEQGLALAQQAIAKDPNQPDFYNLAAMCCYKRSGNGDIQAGEQFLQKAISLNPNESKYWENLGRGLLEEGKKPEAKQAFDKALSCNPSPERVSEINAIMQQAGLAGG